MNNKSEYKFYKIDKNIPVPEKINPGNKSGYKNNSILFPFKNMEVGDSFLYCIEISEGKQRSVANAARNWARSLNNGWVFTARQTENGIRVWRIK